jgi:hypothetical protein
MLQAFALPHYRITALPHYRITALPHYRITAFLLQLFSSRIQHVTADE